MQNNKTLHVVREVNNFPFANFHTNWYYFSFVPCFWTKWSTGSFPATKLGFGEDQALKLHIWDYWESAKIYASKDLIVFSFSQSWSSIKFNANWVWINVEVFIINNVVQAKASVLTHKKQHDFSGGNVFDTKLISLGFPQGTVFGAFFSKMFLMSYLRQLNYPSLYNLRTLPNPFSAVASVLLIVRKLRYRASSRGAQRMVLHKIMADRQK